MSVGAIASAVSNLAIQFGDSDSEGNAMSRPFGVAILFAGVDDDGPQLFHMDPSGTYVQCDAKAIGSGCEGAQQALQEAYSKVIFTANRKENNCCKYLFSRLQSMTLKEATPVLLTILKQVMEEKLNSDNVEIATITSKEGYRMFTKQEIEDAIKEIPA